MTEPYPVHKEQALSFSLSCAETPCARLSSLSWPLQLSPDVIILCHSLADPYSLSRVVEQWLPRLAASGYRKPNWPYVPVLLCGTKEDRRDNCERVRGGREGGIVV